MPAATASHSSSLESILNTLQQSLGHGDSSQAQAQLSKAKLALLQQNALIPSPQTPVSTLATARSILETGALLSIRSRDPESFVRYYSQLQPFYDFPGLQQTPSKDRSKITGLYLLLLLSQSDYAGFHTLLESLIVAEGSNGAASVEEDQFIKYPIELERSLMEGSYDQVWRKTSGRDVPGEEFGLFSDVSCAHLVGFFGLRADTVYTDPDQHYPSGNRLLCSPLIPFSTHRFGQEPPLPRLRRCGYGIRQRPGLES